MAEKKPVQQAVPTEAETDAHVDDLVNKALKALEEFEDFYFNVCNLDYSKMSKAMDNLKIIKSLI